MSNFVRIRCKIEICLIKRSESGISSHNSWEHSTTSCKMMVPRHLLNKSATNQRKVSHSDPLTISRALSLRKELRDLLKSCTPLFTSQRHPNLILHRHGRCVCIESMQQREISTENAQIYSQSSKNWRKTTKIQVKVRVRAEGSRRLTKMQGESLRTITNQRVLFTRATKDTPLHSS